MRLKAKKESPSPNIIMQNKIQMKQFQRDQTLVQDIHHSATIIFNRSYLVFILFKYIFQFMFGDLLNKKNGRMTNLLTFTNPS